MEFTTKIPIQQANEPLDYNSRIMSLGSCFAVNIAEKFNHFKFRNTVNPFGILFHPLALEQFIGFAVDQKIFTENDIFFHNERWHCFDAHSDLSHPDKNVLLENLDAIVKAANHQITESTHVIITLGTAWVYKKNDSGEFVANCHKVPSTQFTKTLLPVDAIANSLDHIIDLLQNANPKIEVIFTVSPVRHLKDGFVENQWSKANLISALQQTLEKQAESVHYFPSYEIMMDELRDYRFYAEDMLHPNQTAINYIWERFSGAWVSPSVFPVMEEVDAIQKALAHKPFNPDSVQHREFLQKLQGRISTLQKTLAHLEF